MKIATANAVTWFSAAHKRGVGRWCVALFTALSFCLVLAACTSHLHEKAAAAHDCALCSMALDKLAGAPPAPLLAHAVALQSYRLLTAGAPAVAAFCATLVPLICGPPPTCA